VRYQTALRPENVCCGEMPMRGAFLVAQALWVGLLDRCTD
jgi:hypothetical protein